MAKKKTDRPNSEAEESNEHAGLEVSLGTPEAKAALSRGPEYHDLDNKNGPNVFYIFGKMVAIPEHWVTVLKDDGKRGRRSVICGGIGKPKRDSYPDDCDFCASITDFGENEDYAVEPPQMSYRIKAGIPTFSYTTRISEVKVDPDVKPINESWGILRMSQAQSNHLQTAIFEYNKNQPAAKQITADAGLVVCLWRGMRKGRSEVIKVDLFPGLKFKGLVVPDHDIRPRFSQERLAEAHGKWLADQAIMLEEDGA